MAPPQVRHCAPHAPFTFPKNWFVLCLQKDYDENDPVNTTTKTLICPGWETPCCPGFPTGNVRPGQKGVPFCPGSGNRDKRNTNRDKRCCQRPRGWRTCYQPGQNVLFFMFSFSQFFFYFKYTFAFQLNLCIGIQCVWSPLIHTYIYIYNICPR